LIGKNLIELVCVDSTNAYADKLLMQGRPEDGDVVWAHEQSAGRGQHDHIWTSAPGKNLTFTVILRPSFLAPDRQFLLNKAVALAVVDFINHSLNPASRIPHPASRIPFPSLAIKWPNDIYAGDKKIGGILIENKIMGATLESSLAGIGVNINQEHFPAGIPNPVSLIHFLHRETALKDALLCLCGCLDLRYDALKLSEQTSLDLEFDQHLMGFGEWRKFTCMNKPMDGKIRGVNNLGQLQLETRKGKLLIFNHGEILFA
jgi:BirA family transcriptional regulator, biotin operon repressor / biotin---[acetyl-CoA-carboxylase] ligase